MKKHIVGVTVLCAILAAACAGVFTWYLLLRYEAGLLDVCAVQQDGYVQLVLDQIRLQGDRDDREIIENILGAMDASSNKYWTFSRDQDMLFVKDVLETNKYKGFTTATYYMSDSARAFLDGMRLDRVSHADITIEGKEYIASGAAFTYQGDTYRLCLLTNRSVLLDNNLFLGAKTELCVMVAAILILFVVVSTALAQKVRRLQLRSDRQEEAVETLNQSLDKMNRMFSQRDLHDTRTNLWSRETLPMFLSKLRGRKAYPMALALVQCSGEGAVRALLDMANVTLDRRVLRFKLEENLIGLLFVRCDLELALENVQSLLNREVFLQEFLLLSSGGVTKVGEGKWESDCTGSTV